MEDNKDDANHVIPPPLRITSHGSDSHLVGKWMSKILSHATCH